MTDEEDPALIGLLEWFDADIEAHPDRVQPISESLYNHMLSLVGDVEIDLDAPICDDDATDLVDLNLVLEQHRGTDPTDPPKTDGAVTLH